MLKKRILCMLAALLLLAALLPVFAGTAKADTIKISEIRLSYSGTIKRPENGQSFSSSALSFDILKTDPAGLESALKTDAHWYNCDTGTPYYGTGTFTPGRWKLYVFVRVKDTSKYEIDYDFFVNDESLFYIRMGGLDFAISGVGSDSINYYTEFYVGETETVVPIHLVDADIRLPIVGEHPDYSPQPAARSHCYSAPYTTGTWKNDVRWIDQTDHRELSPNTDVFQAGHSYQVVIYFTPEDGYVFSDEVIGYLNGRQYTTESQNRPELNQAYFTYTFQVLTPISSASMTLTEPKIGAKPDYQLNLPSGANYGIWSYYNDSMLQNGVAWVDVETERYLKAGVDTFQAGHAYRVEILLLPKHGYAFTDNSKGVLNGSRQMTANNRPYRNEIRFSYSFEKLLGPKYDGTVTLNPNDVQMNGKTPYVIYLNAPRKPGVIVKDKNGKTVDPSKYTVTYRDNVKPGTAFADVVFKSDGKYATVWFKIYLGPTSSTTVQNVENGIQVSWAKVTDAKGYVIYRRAWNLISSGWTTFERWNNTTKTTWTDTKVYAGTRYQYGVKAYYNDPMDNYNLGIVGPLKTTVRITTRTLNSVTPGNKKLTVKWTGSSLFTGYQVQVATDANFTKDVKTVTVSNAKTYQTAVTDLKAKTTYYVRVRSYHIFEGTTYYGQWSNVMNGKTK